MKIAHIVCTFPPYTGGMGNVASDMVNHLIAVGHDVRVVTPIYGTPAQKQEEELHIRRVTPRISYGNAAHIPNISEFLDDADVVHLHYPFFGTANVVRRWKKKHPRQALVVTYHMDTHASGWKGLIFNIYAKFWLSKILQSADALHVSSFDFLKHSQARHIFDRDPNKWHEIPFGVDTHRFKPREKPGMLFDSYSLDPLLPTVLFVGGMDIAHNFKGIPQLLDALALLSDEDVSIQAVFVGDGNMKEQYRRKAQQLNLSKVRFVGRISDEALPVHFNMADVLALPSVHQGEAFGLVQLEALASGVPVIASDLPGVRTIATHAGLTVPPGDVEALVEAIVALLGHKDPEQLRCYARLAAQTEYSWDIVTPRLEAMYVKAMERCGE